MRENFNLLVLQMTDEERQDILEEGEQDLATLNVFLDKKRLQQTELSPEMKEKER